MSSDNLRDVSGAGVDTGKKQTRQQRRQEERGNAPLPPGVSVQAGKQEVSPGIQILPLADHDAVALRITLILPREGAESLAAVLAKSLGDLANKKPQPLIAVPQKPGLIVPGR